MWKDAVRKRPSPSGSKESNAGKKSDFSTLEVLSACSVFYTKCVGVLRMHWGVGRYSVVKGLCSNSKSQPVFPEVM